MGSFLCAVHQTGRKTKDGTAARLWRTGQGERSEPALYKYLMNGPEAGWVSLRAEVTQSQGWWVSAMPLMLPNCPSSDKESLQTHQQRWVEAMLPHINQTHQKFTQASTAFTSRQQELLQCCVCPIPSHLTCAVCLVASKNPRLG